ncbi:MAG: threonylcarbamoyl-AMP synthase [Rhodospirillales bacterium]|nr:threonylcarbamoyl-AMP synthase [Rhodospirillales bacterium]
MAYSDNNILNASSENIAKAAAIIKAGGLVAFSTETVYGLGADATNDEAIAGIYEAKGRPRFNPLIIHFANTAKVADVVDFNDQAVALADAFWPGALTMVLNRKNNCPISLLASAGLETLAVRVPDHHLAHQFIEQADTPIAAPSANRSGEISPTAAEHVRDSLGDRVDAILDGGPCAVGIESTVVDLSGKIPTLLRPGGIAREDIEAVIGPVDVADGSDDTPRSPGMLSRHYAPSIPIRLNAQREENGEALLAFGPEATPHHANLSPSGDLKEAAANLFAMLRMLDRPTFTGIAVMTVPDKGLGLAINDRLKRAATP